MANVRRFIDDPANLMDEIVSHLRTFADRFKNANKAAEDNDRRDPIQMPPEFFPETYDRGRNGSVSTISRFFHESDRSV